MARYRLRLLLQEFDLAAGETVLGRSPECHVTLDDPLVSREHAKIVVEGERALFRDLGSRNGSKLNGQTMLGEAELHDGDRIRLGNQELVFSRVVAPKRPGRATGSLRHCRRCRQPYAAEAPSCPNCGFTVGADETLSGSLPDGVVDRRIWALQLQTELLDKAISLSRLDDAERILGRVRTSVEDWISEGNVDVLAVAPALVGAVRVASQSGDPQWIRWVLSVIPRLGAIPPGVLVEQLNGVPAVILAGAAAELEIALRALRAELPGAADAPEISALDELASRLRGPSVGTGER